MDFSVTQQSTSFLFFCLLGFLTGIFYDFAKVLRILIRADRKTTAVIDVLFLLCCSVFFVMVLFYYNGLGIHIFQIMGAILGLILYFGTLSQFFQRLFKIILTILAKILKFLLYPVMFLCRIGSRILKGIKKMGKKIFGAGQKAGAGILHSFAKLGKRRKKI